jgi:NAD(P)-dependent dehydrogenase (short-subunit alcohol dehydrogenase family)
MQQRKATVAVVGAGDYIGSAIAERFAAEGYTVFAGRRNGDQLAPLKAKIEAAGGRCEARTLDARSEEGVTAFLAEADAHSMSASSTLGPTSTSRSRRPPNGCSARSGKWPAMPASSPGERRPD